MNDLILQNTQAVFAENHECGELFDFWRALRRQTRNILLLALRALRVQNGSPVILSNCLLILSGV